MKRSSWKALVFLALPAATACTGIEDSSPSAPVRESLPIRTDGCTLNIIGDGCEENGRFLLSEILDVTPQGYFSVSTAAIDGLDDEVTLSVSGVASLVASGSGSLAYSDQDEPDRWVGMILAGSKDDGSTLEITGVTHEIVSVPDDVTGLPRQIPLSLFTLEYNSADGTVAGNPCKHGQAIPISGFYDGIARHQEDKDALSFACRREGGVAKCVEWNYPPGTSAGTRAWDANQACSRVVRDDYCKNGTAHTLDQTYVRIWDSYDHLGFERPPAQFPGLNQWPPPPGVFRFEAAWPEDDDRPAICLSKTRWQGLKLGELDDCVQDLPDPRKDTSVAFCDDLSLVSPGDHPNQDLADASHFSESRYTDLRLEQWRSGNGAGNDLTSSVDGYYPGDWPGPGPRPAQIPMRRPFPPSDYVQIQTQGTILRSLPGSIDESEVIDVWTYYKDVGGVIDRVLGPVDSAELLADGFTAEKWEGKVFRDPPEAGIPSVIRLKTYRSRATNDYLNSTANFTALTHELIEPVGYVTVPVE